MAVKKEQPKKTTQSVLMGGYSTKKDAVDKLVAVEKKKFKATLVVKENMFYLYFGTFNSNEAVNKCVETLGRAGFDDIKVE